MLILQYKILPTTKKFLYRLQQFHLLFFDDAKFPNTNGSDWQWELKRFHPFSWKHFHILVILSLRGYNWFYSNCFSIQIPVPDKQVKDYKIIYGMTTDACTHHERIFQNVHLCPKYRQNNLKHSICSNFAVLLYTIIRLVVQRNATVVV